MRVGVFTPLLSQLSLVDVLKKLKSLNIDTVELGTGNYPGDPHCKLSMLDNASELIEFKKKLDGWFKDAGLGEDVYSQRWVDEATGEVLIDPGWPVTDEKARTVT